MASVERDEHVADLSQLGFLGASNWVTPPAPYQMRLFVRVKGSSPFVLLCQDNLLLEHYKEIAVQYFRDKWTGVRQCPELVLVRCICLKNQDRLLDFRRRVRGTAVDLRRRGQGEADSTPSVYGESYNPDLIKQNMVVMEPVTPLLTENCETELIIKNLSLDRLIVKMTDPHTARFVTEVFWDTYREFARPAVVLQKLMERYEVPPLVRVGEAQRSPAELGVHQLTRYKIQMRVVELLEHWVDYYYFDFTDEMQRTLSRWVRATIDRDGIPTRLLHIMRQKESQKVRKPLSKMRTPPPPAVTSADIDPLLIREPVRVLADYSQEEIAQQLTLLTLHVHNHLLPCELMGCKWLPGKGLSEKAPNFKEYRDLINRVANWTGFAIVSEEDFDTRVNLLTKLYMVCEELRQLRNWDMLVAVHGGISDLPSASLRRTHHAVENSDIGPLVVELNELLANKGRNVLREFMQQRPDPPQPVFPSIVVCLKELELIEEYPEEIDGQINYLRMSLEHNLIDYLLQAKGMHLPYTPIPKLQAVFTRYKVKDPEELIKMAYKCEPPG